jgi:D-alanine-D-alanine ligase
MTKVGLAYDLIKLEAMKELPFDCIAEFDSEEAIQAIAHALTSGGHEVVLLEADDGFVNKLEASQPEIVFNIAEGIHGETREAQVPAICEFYGIPYTGSGVLSLSLCLNKAHTNEVLLSNGVMVPPFQVFYSRDDALGLNTEFPQIVKLLHEGSSMGLSKNSVVKDEKALRAQVDFLIHSYHEPVLVQKFIIGREFTVGILGNQNAYTLPITEIIFQDPYGIVMFCPDEEVFPIVKQAKGEQFVDDFKSQIIPKKIVCPADISPKLADQINQAAIQAFKSLECRDWCRVDLRLGTNGDLYVLELNPIAGIAPGYWLPKSAEVAHLNYPGFINKILDIAWERVHGNHPV